MSDLVERLRDADTTRRIGESYADTHERRQRDRDEAAARIEALEAFALKAFTVVEFCSGEGLLLPYPHYDCDDLLMDGVDLLKVETSEEARAALEEKV